MALSPTTNNKQQMTVAMAMSAGHLYPTLNHQHNLQAAATSL